MEIKPFCGWRFVTGDGDVSDLIAPPYDVITPAQKQALLLRNSSNIVAVDLPHAPADCLGPDELYRDAAERLEKWKSSGILMQDETPAIYGYEQRFNWAGKDYIRRSIICCVRATEFGRDVIPHEKTFAGPKADRLKLTQETRMQLSPIFGFYDDPDRAVSRLLKKVMDKKPDATARIEQVDERLWVITDSKIINSITSALKDVPLFIADGHHRYTTALEYRRLLGKLPPGHPANFVMFALTATDDPGLLILPTHRIITGLNGFDFDQFVRETSGLMEYESIKINDIDIRDADTFLEPFGAGAMAFIARSGAGVIGKVKDAAAVERLLEGRNPVLAQLDTVVLHEVIIAQYLKRYWTDDTRIDYTADTLEALSRISASESRPSGDSADLVVLLQGTPIEKVKQIALAGESMPHKSTYFYPKISTGMVLYSLE